MPFLPPFDRYFLPTFINYHTQYGSDGAALAFRFSVFFKKNTAKMHGGENRRNWKIRKNEKSQKLEKRASRFSDGLKTEIQTGKRSATAQVTALQTTAWRNRGREPPRSGGKGMEFLRRPNSPRSRQPCHTDGAETESHRTDIADGQGGAHPLQKMRPLSAKTPIPAIESLTSLHLQILHFQNQSHVNGGGIKMWSKHINLNKGLK